MTIEYMQLRMLAEIKLPMKYDYKNTITHILSQMLALSQWILLSPFSVFLGI